VSPIESPTPLDQRLRLADGRWLGFAEYGDPGGRPVLVFHGLPGSRLPQSDDAVISPAPGLRFIGVDRPGFGLSSFQRRRQLLDWPADVVALADALGLDRFAVLGGSGGGPYALACARYLPERLEHVVTVNGMAPLDRPGAYRGFRALSALSWWYLAHMPGQRFLVAGLQYAVTWRDPARLVRTFARRMAPSDRELLADDRVRPGMGRHIAEAFRAGPRGVAHEMKVLTRPWGFMLADITAAVDLWQGDDDQTVPRAMGEDLAGSIPHCRARFVSGTGHMMVDPTGEIRALLLE
jgi:pimeloyl-ACP methyl ester carboxylesterase